MFKTCRGEGAGASDPLAGIKACDSILAYPAYEDLFWPARGGLLQQRARFLLRLGFKDRALESLSLADAYAAGRGDPFWPVSGGVANELTRIALRFSEPSGSSDAKARARKLLGIRPFSPTYLENVHAFIGIGTVNPEELIGDCEAEARIDPRRYVTLTYLYLLTGKEQLAARSASQITISEPSVRSGWSLDNPAAQFQNLRQKINLLGLQAYASAAAGDSSGQISYMDRALKEIAAYSDPLTLQTMSKRDREAHEHQAPLLESIVTDWGHAIETRRGLSTRKDANLLDEVKSVRNVQSLLPVYMAMMATLERSNHQNPGSIKPVAEDFIEHALSYNWNASVTSFEKKLPANENEHSLGKIDRNLGMWFDGSTTGYSQSRETGVPGDVRTIHYEAGESSAALTEELLAFAIARYARKDGYDGFVILSRHTIPRTTNDYGMNLDAGFDAQARVLMVRGGQIPAGWNLAAGRIITVDEVDRALAARFNQYAEFKARKQAEEKAGDELRKQAKKAARK